LFEGGVLHFAVAGYIVNHYCLMFNRGVVHIVDHYCLMFDRGVLNIVVAGYIVNHYWNFQNGHHCHGNHKKKHEKFKVL
jgi:hypothetical protein